MTLAIVHSRANAGIKGIPVTIEIHLSNGLPRFNIVGLPEAVVKESKDRVRSALLMSHFEFPARRITVNLAPADIPKVGSRFDLPIALGILAASRQIPSDILSEYEFAGELALTGELRSVPGIIPLALGTKQTSRKLIIPEENAKDASIVQGVDVYGAKNLLEICESLQGHCDLKQTQPSAISEVRESQYDLCDVRGQHFAKRALEIAAAGCHSLLMLGPPGAGKTMLAKRLPGLLPLLSEKDALDSASIVSITGKTLQSVAWRCPPFRAPHHTASSVALVGGSNPPRPGEISLAHNGVLFLDELPEYPRQVLDCLREPLECGMITISRAARSADFPASFQLIAAMNPCPCGYLHDKRGNCCCSEQQVARYIAKLSGPLLDRIDMHLEMPGLTADEISQKESEPSENSAEVRKRVFAARERQINRQKSVNAHLKPMMLEQVCALSDKNRLLLRDAMVKFGFSARSYHRILRVARTIADLAGSESIESEHLTEALSYRRLDRMSRF